MVSESAGRTGENQIEDKSTDSLFTRVRHALKFRLVQVKAIQPLSASMVRVTLAGEDLHDFASSAFDDHVKVFFPQPGEDKPVLPSMGAEGPVFPTGVPKPEARDFTPRRFDPIAGELDLEFAFHPELGDLHHGPAARWAAQVKVGQYLGIGGPRGSRVLNQSFDWWLLIGDETALPAIGRRLEELPADSQVTVLLEVENAAARIALPETSAATVSAATVSAATVSAATVSAATVSAATVSAGSVSAGSVSAATVKVQWLYREAGSDQGMLSALRQWQPPAGRGFVWAAGEYSSMQAVREILLQQHALDKRYLRVASYWKRGVENAHEKIEG
ncbi:MAG: siderophore-interacting protein [Methylobacillus glycogenes]|nr:siderophore-interacting protein [Methylobacillus glycogenes]